MQRRLSQSLEVAKDTFLFQAVGSPGKVLLKVAKIAAEVGWMAEMRTRREWPKWVVLEVVQ